MGCDDHDQGLNIGSLRHYVNSYEELLVFARRSMVDRVADQLIARVEDEGASGADRAEGLAEDLLAELDRTSTEGTRRLVHRIVGRIKGAEVSVTTTERLMSRMDGLAMNCLLHPDIVTPTGARAALRQQLQSMIKS